MSVRSLNVSYRENKCRRAAVEEIALKVRQVFSWCRIQWDMLLLLIVTIGVNSTLLSGEINQTLIYQPSVFACKWGRVLLLHPFVHVGWYHLLMDAGAFFLLYLGFDPKRKKERWIYTAGGGIGSLLFTHMSASIYTNGLCGLSGIAHGLMAASAIEMIQEDKTGLSGWCMLGIIIGKSLIEVATGHVIFEFLHFGYYGAPNVFTHIGGVLGGLTGVMLIKFRLRG